MKERGSGRNGAQAAKVEGQGERTPGDEGGGGEICIISVMLKMRVA